MKKVTIITVSIIGLLILINGCSKDNIDLYQAEDSAVYFPKMSYPYSFIEAPNAPYMDVMIPITLIGPYVSYDREVKVEVVPDSTNVPSDQYEILGAVVKADSLRGELSLRIYNSDYLKQNTYKLGISIQSNEDFSRTFYEKTYTAVTWNMLLPRPKWFDYSTGRYVSSTAIYSTKLCEVMLAAWGTLNVNISGWMGTTPDITAQYPVVTRGLPLFSYYMRKLSEYVYNYNLQHPDNKLRHSNDAIQLKTGNVEIPVTTNPLITVNPYGM